MVNEDSASSLLLLLHTNGFVVVVRTSALYTLLTGASLDFAASVSLVSLSHIYKHRGVRTQTHAQQHACRRPIRQCLAHSAFLLPTDWRTEVAREG